MHGANRDRIGTPSMSDERVVPRHELTQALAAGTAVVALESTVIAQGLPWPDNLETARAVMVAVREAGAVPATIAVLDGVIRLGLGDSEIELIARSAASDHGIMAAMPPAENSGQARAELAKANRRDLAAVVAGGRSAATTVSATVWITRTFGLEPRVVATGGLGGVHREAANTFDVSTDLDELSVRRRHPGCLFGVQINPRRAGQPRGTRDPWRARRRLRHRPAARIFHAVQRSETRTSRRYARGSRGDRSSPPRDRPARCHRSGPAGTRCR